MTAVEQTDDALRDGFARWLVDRHPTMAGARAVEVSGLHRPSAGYSSETVIVDATLTPGDAAGPGSASFVIRMAPAGAGTFPHYDLVAQWEAQRAAARVGVPVADPVLETDAHWLGAPFVVMPRVEGHIIGALVHRDRWLGGHTPTERLALYDNVIATLATVHRAALDHVPHVPRRSNGAELDYWDEYLAWSSGGRPVATLVEGLAWCRRHLPATESPPALLWGDVRFENMVFGDDLAPVAVLDWDMTSIGAPEHDLAWFTALDLTMHRLFGERLDGFPDREATIALFERTAGRAVADLEWYETLAMVRSSAIMTRLGYLRRDAGEPLLLPLDDNPVLDVLKERIG